MSQVRQRKIKRQQQTFKLHETREVVTAWVVAGGVVVGTALAVWLMRPGGLADRQPRATWWILIAAGLAGLWIWAAYHPGFRFVAPSKRTVFIGGFLIVAIVAMLLGFFWPGGLLRESDTVPNEAPVIQAPVTTPEAEVPEAPEAEVPEAPEAEAPEAEAPEAEVPEAPAEPSEDTVAPDAAPADGGAPTTAAPSDSSADAPPTTSGG